MGAFSSKASNAEAPSAEAPSETPSHPPPKKEEEKPKEVNKVSKNQRKRQRKWDQAMEVKRRRKEQEKNVRIAQARVDGRDIEKERQTQEQNKKDGTGWEKRDSKWKEAFEKKSSKYQICLDCPFEDVMMSQEINSLASQIRYCYAANKRANHPVNVKVTSLGGSTLACLENVSGFEQWKNKAFDCTSENLVSAYNNKSKLVYLTSDSDNVLDTLEDGKVYIIGGIVDRNRLKRAAINRAEELVSTTSL
jgi:tRNA (guanine9-N1)-methyltransferase